MRCPVCGAANRSCGDAHLTAPVLDLATPTMNEVLSMARKDTENQDGVIRMPQQHVREGRGTAGYKSVKGDTPVEVYETRSPYAPRNVVDAGSAKVEVAAAKTREELDAEATELGLDPADYPNKTAIAEAIAAKRGEG